MYISKYTKGKFPTQSELKTMRIKSAYTEDLDNRRSRDFFSILKKLTKVARVSGILNTRKTAVTAYNWRLKSDTDIDVTEHTSRLSKYIDMIIPYHIDLLFGNILFEIEKKETAINDYANLELKHYELTDYEKIDENNFYTYDDYDNKYTHNLTDEKTQWLYMTDDDLELGGSIDSIADQIIAMNEIIQKWNKLNNRLQGVIIGNIDADELYRNGAKMGLNAEGFKKVSDDLQLALERVGDDPQNVLKTLTGIDIKLASIVESSTANSYALYKETLENDIQIAILGQANTTQLPKNSGSRAALQVLNSIRQDILFNDINNITKLINQFLRTEYYLSTGNDNVPYKFEFDIDDFEDYTENANVITYLANSGLKIPIKKSELYQKIGYAVPEDKDEILMINEMNGGAI